MHSLEDAVAIMHADSSDRPHHLLSAIDDDADEEEPILKPITEEIESSLLTDALGALHIDDRGAARFFGPTGGSEVCPIPQHLHSSHPPRTRAYYW